MVKIWGIPHNRRAKKFKGHMVIRQSSLGGYIVQSWPHGGQYDKSPAGYERSKTFGDVQHWTSKPLPLEQLDAIEGSVGTMYLPRDLLTKNAYGKLWDVHFKDGSKLYSVKLMSEEIQAGLNTISLTPGSIIYRTANEWVALEPTQKNYVLTDQGPGHTPRWQPAQGGGEGGGAAVTTLQPIGYVGVGSEAHAVACNGAVAHQQMTISAVWAYVHLRNGVTRQPFVAVCYNDYRGDHVSAVEYGTAMTDIKNGGNVWQAYKMPGKLQIQPDTPFYVGMIRTDGSGTDDPSVRDIGSDAKEWNGPFTIYDGHYLNETTVPIGTTFNNGNKYSTRYIGFSYAPGFPS